MGGESWTRALQEFLIFNPPTIQSPNTIENTYWPNNNPSLTPNPSPHTKNSILPAVYDYQIPHKNSSQNKFTPLYLQNSKIYPENLKQFLLPPVESFKKYIVVP